MSVDARLAVAVQALRRIHTLLRGDTPHPELVDEALDVAGHALELANGDLPLVSSSDVDAATVLYNGHALDPDTVPVDPPAVVVTEPVELGAGGPWTFDDPDPDA